jgi:hypothetical protein
MGIAEGKDGRPIRHHERFTLICFDDRFTLD